MIVKVGSTTIEVDQKDVVRIESPFGRITIPIAGLEEMMKRRYDRVKFAWDAPSIMVKEPYDAPVDYSKVRKM